MLPAMAKVYTGHGDRGDTNLFGTATKVRKDHPRIAVLGHVDELNAAIGVALEHVPDAGVAGLLRRLQDELFTVGAEVSAAEGRTKGAEHLALTEDAVRRLEAAMEEYDVGPIREFVMPRGPGGGAYLHLARTVARRAERAVVVLARTEPLNPVLLAYLNRLSSLLFVLAVWTGRRAGGTESHPTYGRG